jgi:hypothetical protein
LLPNEFGNDNIQQGMPGQSEQIGQVGQIPNQSSFSPNSDLSNQILNTQNQLANNIQTQGNFGNVPTQNQLANNIQTQGNFGNVPTQNQQQTPYETNNSNISATNIPIPNNGNNNNNNLLKDLTVVLPQEQATKAKELQPHKSDTFYQKITEKILELAKKISNNADFIKKQKAAGVLVGYPKPMIKNARINRDRKERFIGIMGYPTELYKFCVNPFAKVNYSKWCRHTYSAAEKKTTNCDYSFCAFCCDNLPFIYMNQAEKTELGEKLDLRSDEGKKLIKDTLDASEINACKSVCQVI